MENTLIYTHMFLYTHSQTCKHVQYRYSNSHIKLYVIQVKEHCRPSCRENLSVFTCNCLKSMFSSLVFCDENTVLKWVVFVEINVGWLAHSILLCLLYAWANPAINYMFKVGNRNARARCEICSKLTITWHWEWFLKKDFLIVWEISR